MRQATVAGDRFFARVRAADLECPACGEILSFRSGGETHQFHCDWEPHIGHIKCRSCKAAYILGIVAWRSKFKDRPDDQTPTFRQSRVLRSVMAGLGHSTKYTTIEAANIFSDEECTCDVSPSGDVRRQLTCPVHNPEALDHGFVDCPTTHAYNKRR